LKPFLSLMHVASLGLALAVLSPVAQAQTTYRWDMPNTFGRTSSDGVADLVFSEILEKKTNGRIKIVHHFDGSLGYRGVDLLNAVQDGAVPIARHAMSYYGGFDPLFLLSTLPFLIQNVDEVETMHKVAGPHFERTFAKYNQVMVSTGLFPPSGIWSKDPVDSLARLQALKIRAFDLNSLETFNGAGAAAVNMNWGDVIPALSTGAIRAVVTSADLGNASNIQTYLPNFTEINWAIPFSMITINKAVWDKLPDDLKKAVTEAGEEARVQTFERLKTQVAQNYKDMRAKNVNVIEKPQSDLMDRLRSSAKPVVDRWRTAAGANARVLDQYLAAVGR